MADDLTIDAGGYHYDRQDTVGTLRALGAWWQQLADGRTLPDTFVALRDRQARALAAFVQADIGARDAESVIDAFGEQAAALVRHGADATDLLGASLRLITKAGEALRIAGALPGPVAGTVAHLASSRGGVPKDSVEQVAIGFDGVDGDRQRTRLHHGRPWQALCIWSTEVVDAFAADGHPISYGAAGENVTTQGIAWELVRPGVRLRIGEALAEVAPFALPCSKNAQWFLGGDFLVMHHDAGPFSRVYATVLEPGVARVGDAVLLEPR
jgi:MOSC domain-containing protein YiiM